MISTEQRTKLLEAMARLGQKANAQTFLLPRGAKRILDPSVVVVLGARGSGKSALARFLVETTERDSAVSRGLLTGLGGPLGLWFDAFSQASTEHPDASVLDAAVRQARDEHLRAFWLGNLGLRLSTGMAAIPGFEDHVTDLAKFSEDMEKTRAAAKAMRTNLSNMIDEFSASIAAMAASLDGFEENLAAANRRLPFASPSFYITAVYDDLDAIGAFDPTLRARFIRALLAVWSSLSTRYRYLRAKIFLPADLFDTRQFDTVDASKLLARAERLEWDTLSLYRLVLRHLAHDGPETRAWLQSFDLRFDDLGPELGWMPAEPTEEAVTRWLSASLRAVMDVNGTRSPIQRWIPNRLRDGRDRVAPRTLLNFFRSAAHAALHRSSTSSRGRLFGTDDAIEALRKAGEDRVAEIRGIYEWVDRLGALRGRVVPLPRAQVEALVGTDPDNAPKATRPRDGRTVTEELLRLGMLRDLSVDDLLDVPDVFLGYFGALRVEPSRPTVP